MTRTLVVATVCALAGLLPSTASAHHWAPNACGLPGLPLIADYSEVSVSPAIREAFTAVRPPLVLATSGTALAQELRARGAHTVFWYMNLPRAVGTTGAPADPATIDAAADRLYDRAVATTGCATPPIALNELHGAWVPTPWSATNAQYRMNTLAFVRRLHERGAHPYLLVTTSRRPFTATLDAAAWWRLVSEVSDIVLQVHFNARMLYRHGPFAAGQRRRERMRAVLANMTAIGIPYERLGLLHGFQSGRGKGGREGLPLARWLRVVKWEVLAARQVMNELADAGTPLGSDWSWGWGDFPALSKIDRQKPVTACVFLWARHPSLCDGPARALAAGAAFNTSLDEGHIWLRPNVACVFGSQAVPRDAVARFAAIGEPTLGPVGAPLALAALYQRLLERRYADVDPADVARAEQELIVQRFGGDAFAYAAMLAAAGADLTVARHVIGEQLRRQAIAASLAGRMSFSAWSLSVQRRAHARTVCERDQRPPLEVVDLTRWLPFLKLP